MPTADARPRRPSPGCGSRRSRLARRTSTCGEVRLDAPKGRQTPPMAFTLTRADGSESEFGDDDRYRVNEQGLLVIDRATGNRVTLAPAAWLEIDEPRSGVSVSAGY